MLRSLKDLECYSVSALDGELGGIKDFFLDDERWIIRYLIVGVGGILGGRPVGISPRSFLRAEAATYRFHVALTVANVDDLPGVNVDEPGSLPSDAHLKSARDVGKYQIQGSDGAIGHVADFIVDDETWEVRYLVVDVGHWRFGRRVLVSPHWASRVSWNERRIYLDLTGEQVRGSPEWDPGSPVNRQYEERLYDYYGHPVYWANAPLGQEANRSSTGVPSKHEK